MTKLQNDLALHKFAQRRCTHLSARLRATALAAAFVLVGMQQAWANDCIPNQRVPYAMIEIQSMAFPYVEHQKRPGWYSTSSAAQAQIAYDEMIRYARHMRSVSQITQIHILPINENGALVLYGNGVVTCGFLNTVAIDAESARSAVDSANAVFDQEQAEKNQHPASDLTEIQMLLRKRIEALMHFIDYEADGVNAQRYCERLEYDQEIGVIPELDEVEVNGTWRGQQARLLPAALGTGATTQEAERFLSNLVGYEHYQGFWRIDALVLLEGSLETDILIIYGNHFCGLDGALRVPNQLIKTFLNTPHRPERSTQPGDPLLNMTDEERRAWQIIQGIGQSRNPARRLQELFEMDGR
jgi:hypothetical protein